MSLVRYTLPADDPSIVSSTAPYTGWRSTTDAFSSSPAVVSYPLSTPGPSYYGDLAATTSSTSYGPYLAPSSTPSSTLMDSDFPAPTSSDLPPPSTRRSGPAGVSETSKTLFTTSDGYLTLSTLSTFLTSSTAPARTSSISSTNRTALIAALTVGLSALLLLLLLVLLLYRRRRRRRDERLEPPIDTRALPHSALLHDDEMARNNTVTHLRITPATTAQYENSAGGSGAAAATVYRPASPSLSILRSRVSESGSIFREEVWPPPSPTIDPIQMRSSQVDLSRIVDDVMGPVRDQNSEPRRGHKRELTANSTTPLLVERLSSLGHDSSEEDLTHVYGSHSPFYASPTSPLSPPIIDDQPYAQLYSHTSPFSPPIIDDQPDLQPYGPGTEPYAPVMQKSLSQSSHTSMSSSVHSRPGPAASSPAIHTPSSFRQPSMASIQGSIASSTTHQRTQPKVSSPLVRALTGLGR